MLVGILRLSLALKLNYGDGEAFPMTRMMVMVLVVVLLMVVMVVLVVMMLKCLSVLSRACNNFLKRGENYHSCL